MWSPPHRIRTPRKSPQGVEVRRGGGTTAVNADRGVCVPLATLRPRGLTGPSRFLTLSTHLFADAVGTENCDTSAAMNRGLWVMEGWRKVLPGYHHYSGVGGCRKGRRRKGPIPGTPLRRRRGLQEEPLPSNNTAALVGNGLPPGRAGIVRTLPQRPPRGPGRQRAALALLVFLVCEVPAA